MSYLEWLSYPFFFSVAPTLLDYDELLTKTRKFVEENKSLLKSDDGNPTIQPSYTMAARKMNTVAAKAAQLEFLESLDSSCDIWLKSF